MQKSVKTRSARKERDFSIAIITLLFMAVLALIHPQYRSINNYMNILREASFVGIAALGMLNVIITNNTDLSIGTMMALAGCHHAEADADCRHAGRHSDLYSDLRNAFRFERLPGCLLQNLGIYPDAGYAVCIQRHRLHHHPSEDHWPRKILCLPRLAI